MYQATHNWSNGTISAASGQHSLITVPSTDAAGDTNSAAAPWYDLNGNVFSVNSSNQLTQTTGGAFPFTMLARPFATDASYNHRIDFVAAYPATGGIFLFARCNASYAAWLGFSSIPLRFIDGTFNAPNSGSGTDPSHVLMYQGGDLNVVAGNVYNFSLAAKQLTDTVSIFTLSVSEVETFPAGGTITVKTTRGVAGSEGASASTATAPQGEMFVLSSSTTVGAGPGVPGFEIYNTTGTVTESKFYTERTFGNVSIELLYTTSTAAKVVTYVSGVAAGTYAYEWHYSPAPSDPNFTVVPGGASTSNKISGGNWTSTGTTMQQTLPALTWTPPDDNVYTVKLYINSGGGLVSAPLNVQRCMAGCGNEFVVFVGDSISVQNFGSGHRTGNPADYAVDFLRNTVRANHIAYRLYGCSGAQTADWLNTAGGKPGNTSTGNMGLIAGDLAVWPGNVVFHVMLGVNDAGNSVTAATYAANMSTLITNLLAISLPSGGTNRVVIEPVSPSNTYNQSIWNETLVRQYNAQLAALCNGSTVVMGNPHLHAMQTRHLDTLANVHPQANTQAAIQALGHLWGLGLYEAYMQNPLRAPAADVLISIDRGDGITGTYYPPNLDAAPGVATAAAVTPSAHFGAGNATVGAAAAGGGGTHIGPFGIF